MHSVPFATTHTVRIGATRPPTIKLKCTGIEKTYPGNDSFRQHIIQGHTTMSEVGEVASKAKVKTLVLNHFVPTGSPVLDKPDIWLNGVKETFKGPIIVGTDLQKILL